MLFVSAKLLRPAHAVVRAAPKPSTATLRAPTVRLSRSVIPYSPISVNKVRHADKTRCADPLPDPPPPPRPSRPRLVLVLCFFSADRPGVCPRDTSFDEPLPCPDEVCDVILEPTDCLLPPLSWESLFGIFEAAPCADEREPPPLLTVIGPLVSV